MIYCLNTNAINANTFVEKIMIAKEAGYDYIEADIADINEENLSDIRKQLTNVGVKIAGCFKLAGWFENDGSLMGCEDNFELILKECERRLTLAKRLDAAYFIAVPSYSNRNRFQPVEKGMEKYPRLLELGQKLGVEVLMEFMGQTEQINTIEKCKDFLTITGGRMIVDSYHLWRGGGTIEQFAANDPRLIACVHIADASPNIPREIHKDRERLRPGDGCIDLKGFLSVLKKMNYNGIVALGIYQDKLCPDDPVSVAKDTLNKLMRLVDEA